MKQIFAILLALTPAQTDSAIAAYRALASAEVEAKPAAALPRGVSFSRLDVSDKIRSASFGHTTTLLVPPDGRSFYVEYGRSTNRPAALYGPFPVPAPH